MATSGHKEITVFSHRKAVMNKMGIPGIKKKRKMDTKGRLAKQSLPKWTLVVTEVERENNHILSL